MIKTIRTYEHNNETIFLMEDSGARFYEIDRNNTPFFFNSLESAKEFTERNVKR